MHGLFSIRDSKKKPSRAGGPLSHVIEQCLLDNGYVSDKLVLKTGNIRQDN